MIMQLMLMEKTFFVLKLSDHYITVSLVSGMAAICLGESRSPCALLAVVCSEVFPGPDFKCCFIIIFWLYQFSVAGFGVVGLCKYFWY